MKRQRDEFFLTLCDHDGLSPSYEFSIGICYFHIIIIIIIMFFSL